MFLFWQYCIMCLLWCKFIPSAILSMCKLVLQNDGDVGGRIWHDKYISFAPKVSVGQY